MPTRYAEIGDLQPPFDTGVPDEENRAMWSFNVLCWKQPSATLRQELIGLLVAAGIGTYNANIFWGSKAPIPVGPGPYLTVTATGGPTGIRTHNVTTGPSYERPTAQVLVRAESPEAAEGMARAAYAALVGVRNRDVATS